MTKLTNLLASSFLMFMLGFSALTVLADSSVPVMVGAEADYDACGGLGEVRGLNPNGDGFLAVRAGPGTKYAVIDRLYNGDQVYFCDAHGKWIGIVYGQPEQDCNVSSPLPRQQPYEGPCQSGWAHQNWLVLIAG